MNALDVAMTLNALAKLPPAAEEISSPAGWDVLARATHDAAPAMSGKGRTIVHVPSRTTTRAPKTKLVSV